MSQTKTRIIYFLAPLVFLFSEFVRTYIRPEYGKAKYGVVSDILGWLPNLLAGFAIMALSVSGLLLFSDIDKKVVSRKLRIGVLLASCVVSLTGLILHEITQKDTGLHYDVNDIIATIVGVFLGGLYFFLVHLRTSRV